MRQWLTIVRYELLMQAKSIRFKGLVALVALIDAIVYVQGLQAQELSARAIFFDPGVMILYLITAAFVGLFSIARIRSAGMHAILMAKPFPTFSLILGQIVAALMALLVLLILLIFPSGVLLHALYDLDFPLAPLWYLALFLGVPAFCGVLAVTFWVRTCFKNNLVSIIVLAAIFGAIAATAEWAGGRFGSNDPDGPPAVFIPFISYFSSRAMTEWIYGVFEGARVSFLRPGDWINFGSSIVYSTVFMMLACYHLRRTEPQRKVLGRYGQFWHDMPTFARVASDLKVDPHVGWRSHVTLIAMIATIAIRSGWPLLAPHWRSVRAADRSGGGLAGNAYASQGRRYDLNFYTTATLLRLDVRHADVDFTPRGSSETLTLRVAGPTSGTMAVLLAPGFSEDVIAAIELDGRALPFVTPSYCFIEGRQFESAADGKLHILSIRCEKNPAAPASAPPLEVRSPLGYAVVDAFRPQTNAFGDVIGQYPRTPLITWPIDVRLETLARYALLSGPASYVKEVAGRDAIYRFHIKPIGDFVSSRVILDREGNLRVCEVREGPIDLRLAVDSEYEAITRQVLEMARPLIRSFTRVQNLDWTEPITSIDSYTGGPDQWSDQLKTVRKMLRIEQFNGRLYPWQQEQLKDTLRVIESRLLDLIYQRDLWGSGPGRSSRPWDLIQFASHNYTRGLEARLAGGAGFEPTEFLPIYGRIDGGPFMKTKDLPHDQWMDRSQEAIPIFQMLYLVLGRARWMTMLSDFKHQSRERPPTREMLQQAAEGALGQPLDDFFNYWLGAAAGYPAYRVVSAKAQMRMNDADESTYYDVEAEIEAAPGGCRMPLPVRLKTSRQVIDGRLSIGPGERVTWKTTCRDLPVEIDADPDGWIRCGPAWDAEKSAWINQYSLPVEIAKTGP